MEGFEKEVFYGKKVNKKISRGGRIRTWDLPAELRACPAELRDAIPGSATPQKQKKPTSVSLAFFVFDLK